MSDFELPPGVERKRTHTPTIEVRNQEPDTESGRDSEAYTESGRDSEADHTGEKNTPQYDPEELLRIFDEIIFSGEYMEEVTIKNKLKVSFRTRSAGEVEDITRSIDVLQANLLATLEQKRSFLNLRYALSFYQGKDLRTMKLEDKMRFLNSLPAPVIGALLDALLKFDQKVYAACKEGEANF